MSKPYKVAPQMTIRCQFMVIIAVTVFLTSVLYVYNQETGQRTSKFNSLLALRMWNDNFLKSMGKVKTNSLYQNTLVRRKATSQHWQQVGTTDLYVFSACYNEDENMVKIVGLAQRNSQVKSTCKFYNLNNTELGVTRGIMEFLFEDNGKTSSAVFIRCPLKNISNPDTVGLMVESVILYLQVIYPSPRQYNFTVCIPCLHGPYKDPFRIIEMVETDLIFGADHFIVYNHSVSPEVDRVLRHYVKKGKMEVIQWNLPDTDIYYFGQIATLQDCTLASRHKSQYLILKDVDEFIVPRLHKNWHELMSELDKGISKNASYMFMNTFFWLDWEGDTEDFKERSIAERLKITSLLHTWREKYIYAPQYRSKTIVRPEAVVQAGIHFPFIVQKGFKWYHAVDPSVTLVHHYRRRDGINGKDTEKVKDISMRAYARDLIENVNKTFIELGFL